MSNWTPDWKLTVAGSDYTQFTLSTLATSHGRNNIYTQPTASSVQIEIVELDGLSYDFAINDGITLQVKDSAGVYVTLFGGSITDVQTKVKTSGANGYVISYTLIALGALSRLTRSITDGVLSKANDGDQIYEALVGLLLNSWNEMPASETWATYSSTEIWSNAGDVGLGDIDRPGDYELAARTANPTDLYTLIAGLATSGLGYIYEDASGQICYADSTHRSQYLAINGFTDLDANKAIGPGLTTTARAADVRNNIKLVYKNGAYVTASDTASEALYGQLGSVITTSLENSADATSQAAFYLSLRAYPQAWLSSITYPITSPELGNTERDALLNVFMGQPVNITNLPDPISAGGSFQGFIEGWSWKTTYNGLALTLYLSPIGYSLQAMKWSDVPAPEKWNTLSTTMDWLNATIVS